MVGLLIVTLIMLTDRGARWVSGLNFSPGVNAQTQSSITTTDIALPSESTGVAGGTLAVRVFAPASRNGMRHPEGAPVVILAPGADNPGSLEAPVPRASGAIRISFLYPGGRDAATQRSSAGSYDYRGESSIAAMRDVILYAAGQLADSNGRQR